MKKIAQNSMQVKHSDISAIGQAIECGTLDVLLEPLRLQDIRIMPLERTIQHGPHVVKQVILHLTAKPHSHSPVLYTSFLVVELVGQGQTASLTKPYFSVRMPAEEALTQARALQARAIEALKAHLEASGHISRVIIPARYTLPDEWVWAARCRTPFVYRQGDGWQFEKGGR